MNKITKIICLFFLFFLFALLMTIAGLQIYKPGWFLIEKPKNLVPKLEFPEAPEPAEPPEAAEPTRTCYQNYSGKSCYYDNLPTTKPYIVHTKYAWIYNHQGIILTLIFILGFSLNYQKVKLWIRTHSN